MTTDEGSAGTVVAAPSSFERFVPLVEQRLDSFTARWRDPALVRFAEAVRYPLLAGGKRMRPVLVMAAAESAGRLAGDVVDIACAFELVHTYSLVHDDLPAMDDDDLRRGRPTTHRQYDEATAILVGDALQAEAYRLIADSRAAPAEARLTVVGLLAAGSGFDGMVGGQYLDVAGEPLADAEAHMYRVHAMKTAALIEAAVAAGAVLGGVDAAQREDYRAFGAALGSLFQVVDDLLDATGDTARMGKTAGSDARQQKVTAVELLGVEGAAQAADRLLDTCLEVAGRLPHGGGDLPEIARFVRSRDR